MEEDLLARGVYFCVEYIANVYDAGPNCPGLATSVGDVPAS